MSARIDAQANRRKPAGSSFTSAIDDDTRLAYVESARRRESHHRRSRSSRRALAFFARHGITVERVMTDNGAAYRSHDPRASRCRALGIRHLRTRPYRPRTNGKACVLGSGCRPAGRRGSPRPAV